MSETRFERRAVLKAGLAAAAVTAPSGGLLTAAHKAGGAAPSFPPDFLWGASVSGHQTEGNNVASDIWLLENVSPSIYREKSGDACNSFALWEEDLRIARDLGLSSYRFSLEWSRIEPEEGQFSQASLDHYARILDRLISYGITPIVTFHHFSAPRWFSAKNGWLSSEAPARFARFCAWTAGRLADKLSYVVTINEPNIEHVLKWARLPPETQTMRHAMREAAARACGTERFAAFTSITLDELDAFRDGLIAGHKAGAAAIKAACPNARVGLSLSVNDDQSLGDPLYRDAKRREVYEPFFVAAKDDDFIGVQNYERSVIGHDGQLPPPPGAVLNQMGAEVSSPSLANAVRYVHEACQLPVLVTEHGVATQDDALRGRFITESLAALRSEIARGVPILGYTHWALLDNFEWIFGFGPKLGLVAFDRTTFARTVKGSARTYAQIIASSHLS